MLSAPGAWKIMKRVQRFDSTLFWLGAGVVLAAVFISACGLTQEGKQAKFLQLGKQDMANKDYARAAIEFQNAIRINKADAEPYYQLSLAYMGMGDYESGIPALKRALDLNPKHLQAKITMAELLASSSGEKHVRDGEATARQALLASPENTDALNALALAEWKLGQSRNAEMDFMRAVNSAPQNIRASLNLA